MESRLKLRLEAARLAAQLSPTSATERPAAKGMAYLAPGGMPGSEGESIYLQQDGEKVE